MKKKEEKNRDYHDWNAFDHEFIGLGVGFGTDQKQEHIKPHYIAHSPIIMLLQIIKGIVFTAYLIELNYLQLIL